ncbi:hypothetical protein FIL92_00715 [SAR202 cluster bacterium AD-812-D07_MRT_10900m]|nr:hypothetical protein [SAR202 cluster bacterium AD-812-D07_MRT_10900m]
MTHSNDSKIDDTSPNNEPLLPGENEVDRANRLRARGLTVRQVAAALDLSERQTYRLLSRGRARFSRSKFEKWSVWSSRKNNEPIAMAEYLFETDRETGWMQDVAAWAWRVHCLRPELDPGTVNSFARIYKLIDNLDEDDRPHRARLVDLALHHEPWTDEEHRRRYFDAVQARNEGDLEYAAHLDWHLGHVTGRYGKVVLLKLVPIVEDQVDYLKRIVERMQDELDRDEAKITVIREPGREDSKR